MSEASKEGRRGLTRGICELTLETPDPSMLAQFYCGVFGWEEISREKDRIWLGCGQRTRLGLWTPGKKEFGDEGGRHVHFALALEPGQMNTLLERVTALEIEHRGPVEHEGGDRSVYLEDPEGNLVEAWDFFNRGGETPDYVEGLRSRPRFRSDAGG